MIFHSQTYNGLGMEIKIRKAKMTLTGEYMVSELATAMFEICEADNFIIDESEGVFFIRDNDGLTVVVIGVNSTPEDFTIIIAAILDEEFFTLIGISAKEAFELPEVKNFLEASPLEYTIIENKEVVVLTLELSSSYDNDNFANCSSFTPSIPRGN